MRYHRPHFKPSTKGTQHGAPGRHPNQSEPQSKPTSLRTSLALGGTAALVPEPGFAWRGVPALTPLPETLSEGDWSQVRDQFVLARDLTIMNAANLCPSSAPVLESMYSNTKDMDRDPSFNNRAKLTEGKEATRKLLAEFLRVTPDEIIITRNTSEANNLVSSGVELKAGDEVVIFSDNHPSNHASMEGEGQAVRLHGAHRRAGKSVSG